MSPSHPPDPALRGHIIPIGGAEERSTQGEVLRDFVSLCGGRNARIAILPTASQLEDTGRIYVDLFEAHGARARSLEVRERAEASDDAVLERLDRATGIFLTGGNQLRLGTVLGGTPVAQAIRRLNAAGVHVAGTSAGAGFLSEHMIAYGEEGFLPAAGKVELTPGLGLTNRIIVDQHFRQRDRLGRMFSALAANPFAVGLGLDEDTAGFIRADDVVEVRGSGVLTIVDPSEVEYSSLADAEPGDPICLVGIKLHFLMEGWTFDLATRRPQRAGSAA